jgi:hypothetical protein
MNAHDPAQWQRRGPAVLLEGRSHLDGVDALAVEMERRWGVDRLRLLVDQETRLKFDRQRAKLNHALWHGDLDDVATECKRMMAAWRYCDRMATEAGCQLLSPQVMETSLTDGTVIQIVRDTAEQYAVADGRLKQVWTLAEVARVIEAFPEAVKAKTTWPGADVVRTSVPRDPLKGELVDDEIPWL